MPLWIVQTQTGVYIKPNKQRLKALMWIFVPVYDSGQSTWAGRDLYSTMILI